MTIGIICAMYQEYLAIRDVVTSPIEEKDELFAVTVGCIGSVPIVLMQSGVGKIRASLATYRIIKDYGVDMILVIGFSGSISDSIGIGDVFIASQVVDNASYTEEKAYYVGKSDGGYIKTFITDERVQRSVSSACNELPDYPQRIINMMKRSKPNLVQGTLITCDVPVLNISVINPEIRRRYDRMCVDMESFGVYYICSLYEMPCISLRVVSDMGNMYSPIYIMRALSQLTHYMGSLVSDIIANIVLN